MSNIPERIPERLQEYRPELVPPSPLALLHVFVPKDKRNELEKRTNKNK